jgi:hypothetical protein
MVAQNRQAPLDQTIPGCGESYLWYHGLGEMGKTNSAAHESRRGHIPCSGRRLKMKVRIKDGGGSCGIVGFPHYLPAKGLSQSIRTISRSYISLMCESPSFRMYFYSSLGPILLFLTHALPRRTRRGTRFFANGRCEGGRSS